MAPWLIIFALVAIPALIFAGRIANAALDMLEGRGPRFEGKDQ